jgi:hypothetical protein
MQFPQHFGMRLAPHEQHAGIYENFQLLGCHKQNRWHEHESRDLAPEVAVIALVDLGLSTLRVFAVRSQRADKRLSNFDPNMIKVDYLTGTMLSLASHPSVSLRII